MPILFRDYETKSTLDLRDVGAWKYATADSTDVWCCAFAVDDGLVQLWVPGDPVPSEFVTAAANPEWLVSAFNDAFERVIEQHIMAPRYSWPLIPLEQHRCSQAAALALALPAALEKVTRALELGEQKDKIGRGIMMQMARPRKPRHTEDPTGIYWFDDPERLAKLYAYCKQDVEAERALHHRIGLLSPELQTEWVLDAKINARGMPIDGPLLDAALRISRTAQIEINAELKEITAGELETINQPKLRAWLGEHGCEVTDVQKATLRKALTRSKVPPVCRRVMELRLDGAHAAAAKLVTMRNWRCSDGRARGTLRFHGASPGRWTSLGIQVQNMKRPVEENLGAVIDAVAAGDFQALRRLYPQPMSVIGDITRAMICAAPGHRFIAADFSGVESRITAWVSGQQSKLDQWAQFDRTQALDDEPYTVLGRKLGVPQDQARAIGKVADLAFGYMGAEGAWRKLAPAGDTSTKDEIKRRQQTWRAAHPETVRFWGAICRAAIKAIRKPGTTVPCKRIAFECRGSFLFMQLPSGRRIAYPFPKLKTNERGDCVVVFMDNDKGRFVECRHGAGAYGGTWIENAVQAIARDLFAAAMPRLEAAGYPIVLHVHDEIVAEVPDGVGSAEEFLQILTASPAWADGLPVAAKVREGPRFCKIETPKAASAESAAPQNDEPVDEADPIDDSEEDDAVDAPPWEDERPEWRQDESRSGNADEDYSSGERPWGKTIVHYIYRDASGAPYLRVRRTTAKQFPQFHRENDRWVKNPPAGPKIPYRLPELLAAPPDVPVFICEGEKDADNVAALGLVATTNPEGAGKWCTDLNAWFVGKRLAYLLEDNDIAGRKHVAKVAEHLSGIIPTLRVIAFPELKEHGDVSDWLEMGGTRVELLARATTEAKPAAPANSYTLVRASDVVSRSMDWLWTGHILRGSLELLTGLPDLGKSQVHCSLVAAATTGGIWPDKTNGIPAGSVIMLTAEDALDQILVPRLRAAGADLERVHFLKRIRKDNKDRMFLLGEDLELLAKAIAETGDVRLVTLDPITAYMGGKLDSHKVTDVRNQLGPLAELAERLDVAFSAITHPAKNAGPRSIDHFIGSQAFIAAARIGHICVEEIEQNESGQKQATGRRLFANPKNNPHLKMPTIAYRIEAASGGSDPRSGDDILVSRVVWEGIVDLTADEALAAVAPNKDRGQSGAVMFLMDMLAGGPRPKGLVEERAAAHGFSRGQLEYAKRKMGVVAFHEHKFQGQWFWALPQHAPPEGTD